MSAIAARLHALAVDLDNRDCVLMPDQLDDLAREVGKVERNSLDAACAEGFEQGLQRGRDEALPVAFADCEALVVAMLEGMANASMHSVRTEALIGAALAVSLGQHRSAEINEKAIVAAHREAAGFNPSKAGGEARSRALSPRKRKRIAKAAATARWAKERAMKGYSFVIDAEPGEDETHHFETEAEALAYLKQRYPNLEEEGYGLRRRGPDKVADFAPEGSTGRYDVYILGPRQNGDRPVIWPAQ